MNELVFPWHGKAESAKNEDAWPSHLGHLDLGQALPIPRTLLSPMQEGFQAAPARVGGAVGWG